MVDSYLGVGRSTGGGYYLRIFLLVLLSFFVSCPLSFIK